MSLSIVTLSCNPAFGYETKNAKQYCSGRRGRNISKIFDYFPVIGMITGLGRMFIYSKYKKTQKNRATHIIRGLLAATNLGLLLLGLPDLIMTINRQIKARRKGLQGVKLQAL